MFPKFSTLGMCYFYNWEKEIKKETKALFTLKPYFNINKLYLIQNTTKNMA